MCCALGSVDQATSVCTMCKVFKPSGSCPHIRDVCRNRANHPRIDVLYLTNAEVQCFNGCGYCKWAAHNPSIGTTTPAQANPGWPGCCRPPIGTAEYNLIQAADWPSVSAVHHVPIPSEIKTALEMISARGGPNSGAVAHVRRPGTPPSFERRNSGASKGGVPTSSHKPSSTINISSAKSRQTNGAPQLPPPNSTGSTPNRRAPFVEPVDRPAHSNNSSPSSKHADLEGHSGSIKRRSRQSTLDTTPPSASRRLPTDASAPRRSSNASNTTAPYTKSSPNINTSSLNGSNRSPPGSITNSSRASQQKRPPNPVPPPSPSSSSSSSDGSSDGTTQDGGFTDYLSDESEAELQRQAEAKAALVAQNEMEELEFKSARLRLAHVDLRPPKSWTGGANGNSNNGGAYPVRGVGVTRG